MIQGLRDVVQRVRAAVGQRSQPAAAGGSRGGAGPHDPFYHDRDRRQPRQSWVPGRPGWFTQKAPIGGARGMGSNGSSPDRDGCAVSGVGFHRRGQVARLRS